MCKNKTQVDKKRVEATRERGVVRLFVTQNIRYGISLEEKNTTLINFTCGCDDCDDCDDR